MVDPLRTFREIRSDPIGTLQRNADNGQRVPVTRTKTSFSLTIHATVGNRRGVIGAIYEIAPRQSLQVDEEYEINSFGKGHPRELIPQIVNNRTLSLRRYDLYTQNIEQVFSGSREILTLADQIGPVNLRLMWKGVDSSALGPILGGTVMNVYEFIDCYITDIGRTVSAQDDVIVRADATLIWRDIRKLQ